MFFVNFLTGLAGLAGEAQSKACFFILMDEPKCILVIFS